MALSGVVDCDLYLIQFVDCRGICALRACCGELNELVARTDAIRITKEIANTDVTMYTRYLEMLIVMIDEGVIHDDIICYATEYGHYDILNYVASKVELNEPNNKVDFREYWVNDVEQLADI